MWAALEPVRKAWFEKDIEDNTHTQDVDRRSLPCNSMFNLDDKRQIFDQQLGEPD